MARTKHLEIIRLQRSNGAGRMRCSTYMENQQRKSSPNPLRRCNLDYLREEQFLDTPLSKHFVKQVWTNFLYLKQAFSSPNRLDRRHAKHNFQLSCMNEANSITLDPHKSGFCPYPAGGLLYRNGNIRKFLAQSAAYIRYSLQ